MKKSKNISEIMYYADWPHCNQMPILLLYILNKRQTLKSKENIIYLELELPETSNFNLI